MVKRKQINIYIDDLLWTQFNNQHRFTEGVWNFIVNIIWIDRIDLLRDLVKIELEERRYD